MNPFDGYKVYGPYLHKRMNRKLIFLRKDDKQTSISYARYLMCLKEERILEPWEEVDHIDNDCSNDNVSNLQILTSEENIAKYNASKESKGQTYLDLICDWCGKSFKRSSQRMNKHRDATCCSRSCGGKQSHVTKKLNGNCKVNEITHGTNAGYVKEYRQGLEPCIDCKAARAAYAKELRHKKSSGHIPSSL